MTNVLIKLANFRDYLSFPFNFDNDNMTYDDKIEVCNGNIINNTTNSVITHQENVIFVVILEIIMIIVLFVLILVVVILFFMFMTIPIIQQDNE